MKWLIIIGICFVAYLMFKEPTVPTQQVIVTPTSNQSADRKQTGPVILEPSTIESIQSWLVDHTPKK